MNELSTMVIERINRKIKKSQPNAQAALQRLEQDGKIQKDFIGRVGQDNQITFGINGRLKMMLNTGTSTPVFSMHDNAVRQTAEKLGIPAPYLRSLAGGDERQRWLAVRILNSHREWVDPKRLLVRAVGDEVRGVLSDSYRRLNAMQIVRAFAEEVQNNNAVIVDGLYTDTRLFVESLHPQPIIFPTPKNGDVAIAFGARLSTSDYGNGALELRFYLMQGVCLNGMVRESVLRQVHLGKRLPDSLSLSERTYELDTMTTVSAIKDLTSQLFNRETIEKRMIEIQDASGHEVDIPKELLNLQKSGQLFKSEVEHVHQIIHRNNPDDGIVGEASLWKLVQGVTAYSRDAEPERSRELQELAGNLMNRVNK